MANGDIPVTGSAPTGAGSQASFTLEAKNGASDGQGNLKIRTQGKSLHIFVDNGLGKQFDEDLSDARWTLRITER